MSLWSFEGCVRERPQFTSQFPVVIAAGVHLFPFRTEQLSPPAPMVLGGQPPGRVGRRRIKFARAGLWPALARFEANAAHLLRRSQFKARVSDEARAAARQSRA